MHRCLPGTLCEHAWGLSAVAGQAQGAAGTADLADEFLIIPNLRQFPYMYSLFPEEFIRNKSIKVARKDNKIGGVISRG